VLYVYVVYVLVLLDGSLYVGSTAHTREHRAAQHREGGRLAARVCRRIGVRCLSRKLSPKTQYSTRSAAERAERALAVALRKQGRRVHQH
jgi:predicted GIY-YIG superfamily endonuclease